MTKEILVVDDAALMRKMLNEILVSEGYVVVDEAENGMEAYDKYKKFKPSLVIMDITMPSYNGIQGCRLITSEFPDAKILMCSAMWQENMVIESINAGAKGFIAKPFRPENIIEKIREIII